MSFGNYDNSTDVRPGQSFAAAILTFSGILVFSFQHFTLLLSLQVKITAFGVCMLIRQLSSWNWIRFCVMKGKSKQSYKPTNSMNLFSYLGIPNNKNFACKENSDDISTHGGWVLQRRRLLQGKHPRCVRSLEYTHTSQCLLSGSQQSSTLLSTSL